MSIQIYDTTLRDGTGASVRVLIDTKDGQRRWSTVGASAVIIEVSWRALTNGD